MRSNRVAFLVYYPARQRQKNNSFEGNYNIGANVIMDVLQRAGIGCDICTPDTAKEYDVVMISLTSEYDCIALYRAVALLPSWQQGRRIFKVIAGGPGMQNPTVIRNYVDYAVFGRGENIICALLDCALGGKIFEHESVLNMPDISHSVKICQSEQLYPHAVMIGRNRQWQESFIGCPNKCRFCHYTWARKRIGNGTYEQGGLTMSRSVEVLWKDIFKMSGKIGRIRTAFDGSSERLRRAYGKGITNQEIVDGINHVGQYGGNTVILAYNISNMPGETFRDRQELYNTIRRAKPDSRVIVVIQSTPFRASLATPLQWAPVTLFPATSDLSAQVIYDSAKLRAIHSFTNESPYSQLETMIVNRATPDTDRLFHSLCFHPKLRKGTASARIKLLRDTFDLRPYLREYDPEEHPCWFLRSYTSQDALKNAYRVAISPDRA